MYASPRVLPACLAGAMACAALLGQACGGGGVRSGEASSAPPVAGEVSRLEVAAAGSLGRSGLRALSRADALGVLRQSTLDWLAQGGRLAAGRGGLEVRIEVDALHLRSALVTWLFAALARPDRLEARVQVFRRGAALREFRVAAASSLAGFAWRDPGERARRLARRLGRRAAEGL